MTKVVFFGHDISDAAVRRRVRALRSDGLDVVGFMMRRRDDWSPDWENVDLGKTRDGDFIGRIVSIFSGAGIARQHERQLASADVILARNLDMLACAFLAKKRCNLDTPVIYESLDVHRLLTRKDIIGWATRALERVLLRRTIGLVVSSPAFVDHHFEPNYRGEFRAFLVENRLDPDSALGARPSMDRDNQVPGQPLSIGWVGILRCQKSFAALCGLADMFPDDLQIHLHGIPARTEIDVFEPEIERRPNMFYHGRFKSPEDLRSIYLPLDLVWAGDYMEAGFNSVWLLPNRIYEGGFYATPSIAPAGTQTARWLEHGNCGFVIDEPIEASLPALVARLRADDSEIRDRRESLLNLPEEKFVQPRGFLGQIIQSALGSEPEKQI